MTRFRLLKVKRQCKKCDTISTSKSKRKDGTIVENWYIDRKSPIGGWLCLKCYNYQRRNSNTACKEFEISSFVKQNQIRVLYVHKM